MQPFSKHHIRPLRFVELWSMDEWKIKIYTIAENGAPVDDIFIRKAKEIGADTLGMLHQDTHHGCAFITIHVASMFNQIIVDWWAYENELRHLVYKAEARTPNDFQNITHTGEAFCIWELAVIGFERDAWMEHVLNNDTPTLMDYLAARLNKDI